MGRVTLVATVTVDHKRSLLDGTPPRFSEATVQAGTGDLGDLTLEKTVALVEDSAYLAMFGAGALFYNKNHQVAFFLWPSGKGLDAFVASALQEGEEGDGPPCSQSCKECVDMRLRYLCSVYPHLKEWLLSDAEVARARTR